jgi:Secreted repeat of unknown function
VPDEADPGAGAYPSARCAGPLAGLGIIRLRLGRIRRPDGRLQVTFAGFALYRFSGDTRPGDAKGQGFGKVWFAFGPSGRLVGA